jgi:methylase of polypeptide subunit release factors
MGTTEPSTAPRERLVEALRGALACEPGLDPDSAERLGSLLVTRARFEAAVGAPPGGDLAALPGPFTGFDVPGVARDTLDERRTTAETEDVDPASLGQGYERTITADDRDARGQYYTPLPVAEALVRWALDGARSTDEPPRVLDPAVGPGTFLLAAFRSLTEGYPDSRPSAPLDRLVGVDVDAVALQLAGLRLGAAAETPSPGCSLSHRSFFDCSPGDGTTGARIPPVDAVVGNPPFVRAEALEPDAEHFRRHLANFGPDGQTPLLDGDEALSRRSDAYVYFVTQATRFLRPGGRLAFVLPTKWLMSAYGEDLRRFLRERYRVHAVVGFDGRAFGDALVDTALLLAERAPDADATGPMRFVRVEPPVEAAEVMAAARQQASQLPTVERPQRSLTASGSLARYLEAPAELLTLLEGPPFVRLDELADVARGTMTGANRFFFVDGADVERFGIEARFRRPAVKSLRSIGRPSVGSDDIDRWLIDVHPLVAAVRTELADHDALEGAVTDALAARGYDGLLGYVEHAEAEGWHEGRTCQSRAVWFDLGPLRAPAGFVPKLLRERVYAVRNAAEAVPSNAIDGIWPADDVHTGALLAVLNASAGKAAMEVTGRDEAGLLQLMTYETSSLPTLDVRSLSEDAAEAVATAGDAYADDPGPEALVTLDRAVDDAFDLPMAADRLRELAGALRRARVDGGEPVAGLAD